MDCGWLSHVNTHNAQYKANPQAIAVPIEDPAPYRDFFTALGKSLFLEGQQVD